MKVTVEAMTMMETRAVRPLKPGLPSPKPPLRNTMPAIKIRTWPDKKVSRDGGGASCVRDRMCEARDKEKRKRLRKRNNRCFRHVRQLEPIRGTHTNSEPYRAHEER